MPEFDVALEPLTERSGTALAFRRHAASEVVQPLDRRRIVERLVERTAQFRHGLLRRALGREDRAPDADVVTGHAELLGRGHVGDRLRALVAGDDKGLDGAAFDRSLDTHHLLAEEIDMTADEVDERGPGAAIADQRRSDADR